MRMKTLLIFSFLLLPVTQAAIAADTQDFCAATDMKASFRRGDDERFLEYLRRQAVEVVEFSRGEADLIAYCYGDSGTVYGDWENAGRAAKDSLGKLCKDLRVKIDAQAKQLREFRLLLSLMKPRLRSDMVSPRQSLGEKISPRPAALHSDIRPAPLTRGEIDEAAARYDDFLMKTAKEKFPDFDYAAALEKLPYLAEYPPEFRSYLRYRVEEWRLQLAEKAKSLLEQNPFLSHFAGPGSDERAVVDAAHHLKEKTTVFLEELRDLRPKDRSAHVLMLFQLGGTVDAVLREHPDLCAGANEVYKKAERASTRKELLLAVAVPVVGSACTIVTKVPVWCFAGAGTLAAGMHFMNVRKEMRFQAKALDSAVSRDVSLINALEQLDDKQRELFIAGILVVLPYEAGFGKVWEMAERNPVFHRVVLLLGDKVRVSGKSLLLQVLARMRG